MRSCPRCRSLYSPQVDRCLEDGERLVDEQVYPFIGQTLDRYRIVEAIGEGAMGCVYRAAHAVLPREYAIKILFRDLASNQTLIERFRREAQAVSQLAHPNIVSVVDFVSLPQSGATFIVMELVPGRTLERAIGVDAPFAPSRAARIARQIAAGLGEAHRMGFVHRDVKPSNIMLTGEPPEEQVKILDFGVVGLGATPMTTRLTAIGHIIGTPTYMAPEQVHDPGVGPGADLYALGVLLYEMLSGAPPFTGPGRTEILVKHISEPPPPLPPCQGLDHLAMWLLEKRAERRPKSAEEVIHTIDRLGLVPRGMDATKRSSLKTAELRGDVLIAPVALPKDLRPPIRPSRSTSFEPEADTYEVDTDSAIPKARVQRALADTDPEGDSVPLVQPVDPAKEHDTDEERAPTTPRARGRRPRITESSDDHFTSLSKLPESLREWTSYGQDYLFEGAHPDPADSSPLEETVPPVQADTKPIAVPRADPLGSARIVPPLSEEAAPQSSVATFVVRERIQEAGQGADTTDSLPPHRESMDLPTDVMLMEPELPPPSAGQAPRPVDDGPTQVDFNIGVGTLSSGPVSVVPMNTPELEAAGPTVSAPVVLIAGPAPLDLSDARPVIHAPGEARTQLDFARPAEKVQRSVLDVDTLDLEARGALRAPDAPERAPWPGGQEAQAAASTQLDTGRPDTLLDLAPPDFVLAAREQQAMGPPIHTSRAPAPEFIETMPDRSGALLRAAPAIERRPLAGSPIRAAAPIYAPAELSASPPAAQRLDPRLVVLVVLMFGCAVLLVILYLLYFGR